jgi:hypothetical protein
MAQWSLLYGRADHRKGPDLIGSRGTLVPRDASTYVLPL